MLTDPTTSLAVRSCDVCFSPLERNADGEPSVSKVNSPSDWLI